MPAKQGRPSKKSPKVLEEICERIAGKEALENICAEKHLPTTRTIHRWLREDDDFCQDYARARERAGDAFAAEIIAIADNSTPETANCDRLKADVRKWYAGKLNGKYSDKQTVEMNTKGTLNIQLVEFGSASADTQ